MPDLNYRVLGIYSNFVSCTELEKCRSDNRSWKLTHNIFYTIHIYLSINPTSAVKLINSKNYKMRHMQVSWELLLELLTNTHTHTLLFEKNEIKNLKKESNKIIIILNLEPQKWPYFSLFHKLASCPSFLLIRFTYLSPSSPFHFLNSLNLH